MIPSQRTGITHHKWRPNLLHNGFGFNVITSVKPLACKGLLQSQWTDERLMGQAILQILTKIVYTSFVEPAKCSWTLSSIKSISQLILLLLYEICFESLNIIFQRFTVVLNVSDEKRQWKTTTMLDFASLCIVKLY